MGYLKETNDNKKKTEKFCKAFAIKCKRSENPRINDIFKID